MTATTRREAIRTRPHAPEVVDPVPIHIPGEDRPLSLREEMRRFIRDEISKAAVDNGVGSFEEEDDFEAEDAESDMLTPYTVLDMQPEPNEVGYEPDPVSTPAAKAAIQAGDEASGPDAKADEEANRPPEGGSP